MIFSYFQIVEIPYECNERVSMIIVLPTSKYAKALDVLLKALKVAPDMLNDALKNLRSSQVNLSIPKFRIETNFDLRREYEAVCNFF